MSNVRTFGQVVDFHIGGGWGQAEPTDDESAPAYVIRGTDIPSARHGDVSGVPLRFHKPAALGKRRLLPGDIVFESSGGSPGQPVGRALRVTDALLAQFDQPVMCASFCKMIRPDPAEVEGAYLFYSLLNSYEDGTLSEYQVQSTGITNFQWKAFLEQHLLDLPSARTQLGAAELLATIDDLIENNRRRIEVLEKMTQMIYREWFVNFRYPGHEDASFVDSPLGPIPEGWEVRPLGELATIVRGRSYRKYELAEEGGLPFVNLKCMMRGGGFRIDGLKRYTGDYKPEQLVSHGDIVLAVTDLTQGREILAQATLVPRMTEEQGVISLDVARILPNSGQERIPLFFSLRCTDFADRVKEYANGSTVLHLSPKFVEQNELAWPEQSLRLRFRELSEPMVVVIDDLRESAERLASIRHLLLPKVVTGEIDLSELNFDALVGAAS